MSRPRFVPAVAGIALASLLVAGCGTNRPPSQSEARDDIQNQLVAQGIGEVPAAEVADCMSQGLYESGDFTKEERDEVIHSTDADPPDPDLVLKVEDLRDTCAQEAGVEVPNPDADQTTTASSEASTTTSTEG